MNSLEVVEWMEAFLRCVERKRRYVGASEGVTYNAHSGEMLVPGGLGYGDRRQARGGMLETACCSSTINKRKKMLWRRSDRS